MKRELVEKCSRLHVDYIVQEFIGILPNMPISSEIRDSLVHSCTRYLEMES